MLISVSGSPLLGRRAECEMLDRLVADVRAARSRVLALRGEAGVGKTALMDHVASVGASCRVVRAVGVESEMELPFAGLHQLCGPMLHRLDRLPGPQRDALGVAFGLVAGQAADRFLVGLAVLTLLGEVAEDQPLLCLVDDAQWLDQVSAQILAFVSRRLLAEPVGLVFAVREPSDALDGLPSWALRGLSTDDAGALLDAVIPGRLDERVRERILAETHGNPLALLELPRGLTAAELAGGFALPDTRPLASHVEQNFVRRVQALPAATQRLLLIAAAEAVGDGALLRRAALALGIDADAEGPAEADRLIEFGARVRFRHPLVRSAAYRSGSVADRREVHRALAGATDPQSDPDRRAWHLAHAAADADDEVAADLERSAQRAHRRGGVAAAAAFLERAAALTADPARRGARALAAAQAKFDAADPDAAERLLAAAAVHPLDEGQAARLDRLRAQIVQARHRGNDGPPLLFEAANRLATLDPPLARETYLEALGASIFAGRLCPVPGLTEIAAAARASAPPPASREPTDALLVAVAARFIDDHTASAPVIREALQLVRRQARDDADGAGDVMRWLWLGHLLAGDSWDDEAWHELASRGVAFARETGALGLLPLALTYEASVHLHAGELERAITLLDESDAINAAIGNPPLKATTLNLVAWRGNEDETLTLRDWGVENAIGRGEGRAVGWGGYVTAVLYNGLGRYPEALAGALQANEHDDLGVTGFALVELVEAAARCGAAEVAAHALARLEQRTSAAGTDWALGVLARSRALLSDGDAADAWYRESIERLGRTRITVHLARAHLLYGEWLRRANRRRDAREQLRTAHDMFQTAGNDAFAGRAERELRAAGEAVPKRTARHREQLTPQESQIARLAAEGRTNAEIGSELFISAKTVEYHLSKVYPKLGITTRRALRGALVDVGGAGIAP